MLKLGQTPKYCREKVFSELGEGGPVFPHPQILNLLSAAAYQYRAILTTVKYNTCKRA